MKKGDVSIVGILLLVVLLAFLGFLIYYLWVNFLSEPVEYPGFQINNSQELKNYTSSPQFYPNMRFQDNRISYNIEDSCDSKKRNEIVSAFDILSQLTVLRFYESSSPQISAVCSEFSPESGNRDHFIVGEGGPTEILNVTRFSVILSGKFSLFRNEKCKTPQIATHEILHVLGFNHNNNPKSILYPTSECDQILDSYIINRINEIYSTPSLPDLVIKNVAANKTGPYLNFDISIVNYGLRGAGNTSLSVYDGDELAKTFNIGSEDIGTSRILSVRNIRISRNLNPIKFSVDDENKIKEISEENNIAILRIK